MSKSWVVVFIALVAVLLFLLAAFQIDSGEPASMSLKCSAFDEALGLGFFAAAFAIFAAPA